MCNYARGHHEGHFCEIIWNLILNMDQWFRMKCCLKRFLILSPPGPFVPQSETICAILVEGITSNIFVNLFCIWTSGSGGVVV